MTKGRRTSRPKRSAANGAPGTTRAFLALLPDPGLADAVASWRDRNYAILNKPVAIQNLHMTLAFLGNIDDQQRRQIEASMQFGTIEPFEIVLDTVTWWPDREILWLGPSAVPEPLGVLARESRRMAREAGIAVGKRRWQAHVSLARRVSTPAPPPLVAPEFHWRVDGFALQASRLNPDGPVYETLHWQPVAG